MAFYSALLTFCINSFTGGKRKVRNRDETSEVINTDRMNVAGEDEIPFQPENKNIKWPRKKYGEPETFRI